MVSFGVVVLAIVFILWLVHRTFDCNHVFEYERRETGSYNKNDYQKLYVFKCKHCREENIVPITDREYKRESMFTMYLLNERNPV